MDSTYDTALEQANVILRYFLGMWRRKLLTIFDIVMFSFAASGRVQLAQRLLEMVPPELASISEPEDQATEYLHYRQFFLIWETLEKVVEYQAAHVPGMTKEEHATWLAEYRVGFFTHWFSPRSWSNRPLK